VSASLAMDDLIASTGVNYRALTMPSFMDNVLRQLELIRNQGVFFSAISGDRKLPTCATRDIAVIAARLLIDRSWSGQGSVPVLGPEDLSFNDMAQIMSEVLEPPVRFQQIPGEAFKARLTEKRDLRGNGPGNARHARRQERGPRQRRATHPVCHYPPPAFANGAKKS
jgi:uncharacterized protein YbjT (DUF2867 family)